MIKKTEKLCKKLLKPPIYIIILLVLFSTVSLIAALGGNIASSAIKYFIYFISAYTLTVVTIFGVKVLPGVIAKLKDKLLESYWGNRYITDAAYKVKVSLYISLGINIAFSVYKLIAGLMYSSKWLMEIGVYYILLSLIRYLLLHFMRKKREDIIDKYRRYRLCGIMLLILNVSLIGIIAQMTLNNMSYKYPGYLIYIVALYTFYSVIISIVDMVRYKKYEDPILSASKIVRFVAALVSMLTLETAMMVQFGDDAIFRVPLIALTGLGVCLIVLSLSAFMIVNGNKVLNRLSSTNKDLL